MRASEPFKIGIIGCGTVGGGVLELLKRRRGELLRLLGRPLEVRRIVVRNPERRRPHLEDLIRGGVDLSSDPRRVTREPGVDLVVEVAGGTEEPRDWILDSLAHGRDVVTANKAVLAFHGGELFEAAAATGRSIYYEASVAGAIPIIEILQNGLVANQMTQISGILNGTCNYILTRMDLEHMGYKEALEQAQAKGFAETDPTLDVSGGDSAHKLALIAGILTRAYVPAESVYTEGLDGVTLEDVEFVRKLRYTIKMLAIARRNEHGAWELRVHPTLIPEDSILAGVRDEFNAVHMQGDAVGSMLAYGKGAGALPTASSIVGDIVRAARGERGLPPQLDGNRPEVVAMEDVELRHYIRMTVLDLPGVLGKITSYFGLRQISISSIHQPDARVGSPVPIVLVTHAAADRVVSDVLRDIEGANLLVEAPMRIRIEE